MDQPTKPPPTPAKKLQCSLIIPRQERLEPGEGPELAGEVRRERNQLRLSCGCCYDLQSPRFCSQQGG